MRKTSMLMLAVPMLMAPVGAAFAHAWPRSTVPQIDGTVTGPPTEVSIAFSGVTEPAFSGIEVTDAGARRVDDTRFRLADGDSTRLSVGPRILAPGLYTVGWHATSVDTHQTNGTFHFTLAAADTSGIRLEHVWARPTMGASTTGAAYFTITDTGQPDHLVAASTPVAALAEVHETINDNGVMKMRPVPSLTLDPGKPVTLKPGGYHIMLTGLKSALKPGDSFPLTLTFEHAQPVTVTVKVEAMGGGAADHGSMQGMPGMSGH